MCQNFYWIHFADSSRMMHYFLCKTNLKRIVVTTESLLINEQSHPTKKVHDTHLQLTLLILSLEEDYLSI